MDTQRQGNGYGMNAISFREIKAWADLREISFLPWQLDAIIALDIKRRSMEAVKAEEPKDEVSAQPLTPSAMKYLFPGQRKRFSRDGKLLN